ncbi:hypothetical protein GCM10009559_43150 [Pseudonocardia zijingensis]|uniref:Uncharacterized protein n=1 Tax=Pseudonocardia zijingensis TaxID=153376 RepID=A0ABN1QNR4_9PSEU
MPGSSLGSDRLDHGGDVGGQDFEARSVDEVPLDVVSVVFGTGEGASAGSEQVSREGADEVVHCIASSTGTPGPRLTLRPTCCVWQDRRD